MRLRATGLGDRDQGVKMFGGANHHERKLKAGLLIWRCSSLLDEDGRQIIFLGRTVAERHYLLVQRLYDLAAGLGDVLE